MGSERGQAIIEFVLVLPVMAILLFAVVDFGLALHQRTVMTDAVSQAAEFGARTRNPSANAIKVRGETASGGLLARGEFTVLNFSCAVDGAVRVKVDHQYRFLTPISGLLDLTTGSAPSVGITMTAESQWRREVAC